MLFTYHDRAEITTIYVTYISFTDRYSWYRTEVTCIILLWCKNTMMNTSPQPTRARRSQKATLSSRQIIATITTLYHLAPWYRPFSFFSNYSLCHRAALLRWMATAAWLPTYRQPMYTGSQRMMMIENCWWYSIEDRFRLFTYATAGERLQEASYHGWCFLGVYFSQSNTIRLWINVHSESSEMQNFPATQHSCVSHTTPLRAWCWC